MKTSIECPACQGRISLWHGMMAPTPNHFRCPHCRAGLRVQIRGLWAFLLVIVAASVAVAYLWMQAWHKFGPRAFWAGLAGLLAVGLLGELAFSLFLYSRAKFVPKNAPDSAPQS